MIGPANAYPNKPTLSDSDQLQEETSVQPLTANYRKQVYAVLKKLFTSKLTDEQICTLESCIYNGAIHESKQRNIIRVWTYPLFVHMYKMRARKIMSNFDATSYVKNTDLFDLFQQGSIDFKGLAAMNTYEMFPSRWRDQFEKQQIREKKQLEGNRDMATDQFLCTRCHKRQCTYYELQTRSADEPMTIFITCVNCGKKWRQ
jgi:transcription elongation factor S-II